jgi:hypothetical protein
VEFIGFTGASQHGPNAGATGIEVAGTLFAAKVLIYPGSIQHGIGFLGTYGGDAQHVCFPINATAF